MSEEKYSNSSKTRPKIAGGGRSIYCCIPECGSSFYDRENKKTNIGFFKFPKEKSARQVWIRAVNNVRRKGTGDNFNITDYTRICEFHFKKNDVKISIGIGRKTLKLGTVPVFKKVEVKPPLRRSPRKRTIFNEIETKIAGNSVEAKEPEQLSELDVLRNEVKDLRAENLSLKNEARLLRNEIQELKKYTYNYQNLSQNEKLFKPETGLDTESFEMLFDFLNPGENCENFKMYDSKQKDKRNDNADVLRSPKEQKMYEQKPGPNVKLKAKDQLFLYMTWLKGGFSLQYTSWLFSLTKPTASSYLITWSNFMYFSLASIPIWPSKYVIRVTMPETFKETYPKTRCIIDCTELFCQRNITIRSYNIY